jgi:hypothetical protein
MGIPVHDGLLQIFDVDHGQCALLTLPNGIGGVHRILVDCGHAVNFRGAPWYPGEHLASMGVRYLLNGAMRFAAFVCGGWIRHRSCCVHLQGPS